MYACSWDLLRDVYAWIDTDIDEADKAELRALAGQAPDDGDQAYAAVADAAVAELADRFAGKLEFGTAGLRAAMAAGPNRMNRATVVQASWGLAEFLKQRADTPKVVIGNDARHHSRQFALDAAGVFTASGAQVWLLPDQVPTPVLAYAVRQLDADAGVMVTASHNPAADNGYKVYLGGRLAPPQAQGVQIVPPSDSQIAALIAAAPPANQIERRAGWTDLPSDKPGHENRPGVPGSQALISSYVDLIARDPGVGRVGAPIRIVHTAMHGVGSSPALAALHRAGFADVVSVEAQREPDPDFPTVGFPNPEEPGAIDLAIELAKQVDADVVIANDPDADRCAVAVPDPPTGWRMLHGDEVGAALAEDVAGGLDTGVLANSVVSSRQLAVIAAEHGLGYARTLTGFKWLGRVDNLAYAYEEAIGYCVRPDLVRDKDGISAAVAVARLVSRLKGQGRTLIDLLDDLAYRHGLYLTSQLSVRVADPDRIAAVMTRLRQDPPAELAGSEVSQVIDLAEGWDDLPPTEGIVLMTAENDRVIVRPSGTEPKVKCYLEVIWPVPEDADRAGMTWVRESAAARLETIKAHLQKELFAAA